jgi:hemoglobin
MSLLDELGGRDAIEIVVAGLYERVLRDPHLARFFRDVARPRLQRRLVEYLCAHLADRPAAWRGRDLRAAHAGLAIDGPMFDAFLALVAETLTCAGVADSLVSAVLARLEPLRADIVR